MISVIIPALNEEEVIGKCLRSLRDQHYSEEFSVIVVDNGSTDRTGEIAKKYSDKVLFERERGKYAAGNLGAREAEGEILAFLDADTVVDENWIASIDNTFNDPQIVGATCPVKTLSHDWKSVFLLTFYDLFVRGTIKLGVAKSWGAVIIVRKKVFDLVGGFNERNNFEDLDLVAKVRDKGNFVMMDHTSAWTSEREIKKRGVIGTFKHYLVRYIAVGIQERI